MNIQPITSYRTNCSSSPTFQSCIKIYNPQKLANADIFSGKGVRTTSNLFRNDLDWDYLMKQILLSFMDKKAINIYSLGCSDGSEPYSYALYIKDRMPEQIHKKFAPIIACDIDSEMIKIAKSGKINLSCDDFLNMRKYLNNVSKYFKEIDKPIKIRNNIIVDESGYEIAPQIKNMVKFKKSDILTELDKINDEGNSVINIRNVFPYLSENYINKILETLSAKTKPGSIFVFGNFDNRIPNFKNKLADLGFSSFDTNCNFVQKQ